MSAEAPPGYVVFNGSLTPAPTVAGYAERGQAVRGACRARGCNRHVQLDPAILCGGGQGRLTMEQVKRAWRCNRIDGCEMEFHNEPPERPLRLAHLVGKPNVRVRIRCRGPSCSYIRTYAVERLIAALIRRKQGDDRSEVEGLAARMTSACPTCKTTNWAVDVVWIDTSTMAWRTQGERAFTR